MGTGYKLGSQFPRSFLIVFRIAYLPLLASSGFEVTDIDVVPIVPVSIGATCLELEFHPEFSILEEDVGILQQGDVVGDALPLSGKPSLAAFDEANPFQLLDPPVARGYGDPEFRRYLLCTMGTTQCSDQDLDGVLVCKQL